MSNDTKRLISSQATHHYLSRLSCYTTLLAAAL
jgi:hypothetical protein